MKDPISQEQLQKLKENCMYWANNCGGCETCTQLFAYPPPYDHHETFDLILMIEARDQKIKKLEEVLEHNSQTDTNTK